VIPSEYYYPCLHEWWGIEITKPGSIPYENGILMLFNGDAKLTDVYSVKRDGDLFDPHYGLYNEIRATSDMIHVNRIENANTQGVQYLKDLRYIEAEFGLPTTFDRALLHYDFE